MKTPATQIDASYLATKLHYEVFTNMEPSDELDMNYIVVMDTNRRPTFSNYDLHLRIGDAFYPEMEQAVTIDADSLITVDDIVDILDHLETVEVDHE